MAHQLSDDTLWLTQQELHSFIEEEKHRQECEQLIANLPALKEKTHLFRDSEFLLRSEQILTIGARVREHTTSVVLPPGQLTLTPWFQKPLLWCPAPSGANMETR